jgi:hypothetical protein
MGSAFGRLGFNYDTDSFGDAQYLTPAAVKTLNASPITMPAWQITALENGIVNPTDYLKNPHTEICSSLSANTLAIKTITTTDPANTFPLIPDLEKVQAITDAANNYIVELVAFKSHTDNISGIGPRYVSTETIPNYDMAVSIGQQLLRITNATDNVSNTTPMLGSFTSLFIGPELTANNTTIRNNLITMESLTAPNGNCYMSNTQAVSIAADINSAYNLVRTRRLHDWNFYSNSVQILNDYLFLDRFNNLGNTQLYLVNNLIGTETLVNNLANTA